MRTWGLGGRYRIGISQEARDINCLSRLRQLSPVHEEWLCRLTRICGRFAEAQARNVIDECLIAGERASDASS